MSTAGHDAPAIAVESLSRRFGALEAVRGLSFEVARGELFGFLGPNGAGKTTTLRVLTTLLAPSGGRAAIDGLDVAKDPRAVRRRIGVVFQEPSLDHKLTGEENLAFHARLCHVPRAERAERVRRALDLVGLAPRARDVVSTYSGGMKRRIEIARALLNEPAVLFLDEPTVGLDPQTRSHIWEQLERLRDERRATIFLTTHQMDEAERCDRVAIIDHGALVALERPDALKRRIGGDVVTIRRRSGALVRHEVADGEAAIPRLLAEHGPDVASVSLSRPTLDDVFLKLTGREIREESASDRDRLAVAARTILGSRAR